ncbi:MAG: hypothetical protein QOD69_45 [Solirubrobacteraceae bacterium]|jgi:hypothetical protein|nr:hypothetical protein [Solirubrobacteraceae bacterium]
MKRSLAAAAASAAVLLATAASASAAPTPTFTTMAMGNQTLHLDASASPCANGPCGYTWKYFGPTTNRLGAQMGRVATIDFRFPSIGFYTVTLTVSGKCSPMGSNYCPGTASQQVTVAT